VLPAAAMLVAVGRPSGLAWFFSVRQVSPADVMRARAGDSPPLVLDVRHEEEYRAGHVAGAQWVPLGKLGGFLASQPVPDDREIVAVCAHGRRSLAGAAEVAAHGHARVASLAGGTEAWRALGLPMEAGLAAPTLGKVKVVDATWLEQLLVVVTAFVVKPTYMLLALALGLWLWRRRERDLSLLGTSMVLFFVGEALCALRFVGAGPCDPLELGHGLGMVAMGGWFSWGLFELFDRRVLGYSDPARTCVLGRFCQRCWKREAVPCGLHRIMRFVLPVLMLLSLVPLTAMPRPKVLEYPVFGTMVPDEATPFIEIMQMRVYPIFALWLFVVASFDLRRGKTGLEHAKAPFFVGMGFLSYALLRFFLQYAFGDAVFWANAWEEVTELATVLTLIWILWVFRVQLALGRRARALPAAPQPDSAGA
jgi:rhodanese-related sulfurtransferase